MMPKRVLHHILSLQITRPLTRNLHSSLQTRNVDRRELGTNGSNIFVINCGSSSIKFQILEPNTTRLKLSGIAERIGTPSATIKYKYYEDGQVIEKKERKITSKNIEGCKVHAPLYLQSLKEIGCLVEERGIGFSAIGHRVVHGGEKFHGPVKITEQVKDEIKQLADLAPLHNPTNLLGIDVMENLYPSVVQTAVFDTSFHQTIPEKAYRYAIPEKYYKSYGVRRYGFHGTSHQFVINEAARILEQPIEELNMVSCHLGNGCSAAVSKHGACLDTTMGFSPLEGLVMGQRSGDIDPTVITFLENKTQMSLHEIMDILNKQSGFQGITGVPDSRDVETLFENGDLRCKLAIDMFCYRLAKYIASYAIVPLNGKIDALVFTGGIGENSFYKRKDTLGLLTALGFTCDDQRNNANGKESKGIISEKGQYPVAIVIPTNEELIIARETLKLILS